MQDIELSLRLYLSADDDEEEDGELAVEAAACLPAPMPELSRPNLHLCKDSVIPKLPTLSRFPDAPLSAVRLSGPPLAASSLSSSAQRSLCLCLCLCL